MRLFLNIRVSLIFKHFNRVLGRRGQSGLLEPGCHLPLAFSVFISSFYKSKKV